MTYSSVLASFPLLRPRRCILNQLEDSKLIESCMSILNDFVIELLDFLGININQEKPNCISNYPDTPRLNGSLRELLPEIGMRSGLIIPATESSLEHEGYFAFKERLEKESSPKYRRLAEEDFFVFLGERQKLIKDGFMYVTAERIKFNLVQISACINDRGCGDEDGFGVEPDTFVEGYLSIDGEFVSPVALEESNTNTKIKNCLAMDVSPVSLRTIKIFPYE